MAHSASTSLREKVADLVSEGEELYMRVCPKRVPHARFLPLPDDDGDVGGTVVVRSRDDAVELAKAYLSWYRKGTEFLRAVRSAVLPEWEKLYVNMGEGITLGLPDDGDTEFLCELLGAQIPLLHSVSGELEWRELDLYREIALELVGNEMDVARELVETRCYRPGGVVAGVALELFIRLKFRRVFPGELEPRRVDVILQKLTRGGILRERQTKSLAALYNVRSDLVHGRDVTNAEVVKFVEDVQKVMELIEA